MKLFISKLKSCELIRISVINHFTNNIAPQVYILTAGAVSTNTSLSLSLRLTTGARSLTALSAAEDNIFCNSKSLREKFQQDNMYSSVTMILMSLLIPELVRGWCQFIPQETLAIPGKKSKGHLRLRAFILITNFRLCDGHKNISLFFDDRIFSTVFCKLFLYHYSFAFYYFCSVIRLSLQGLHPGSLSAELPRRKNLSGL